MSGPFDGVFCRGRAAELLAGDGWLAALLDTEAALARAAARAGLVEASAAEAVTAAARPADFDVAALAAAATGYGNPVPPLVRMLTGAVPASAREAVHPGATSQDIMDTALMLLVRRASEPIGADLGVAAQAAAQLAERHRDTPIIGRTLLQQAEPSTFGLTVAGWLTAIDDARGLLAETVARRLAVQYGGAVGNTAAVGDRGPSLAALLAEELDLVEPPLPWHTDRQRIVHIVAALAAVGAALGKPARDVTLLAQNEIAELTEAPPPTPTSRGNPSMMGWGHPRTKSGGGSSAMPHKRNPVAAISVLGCTRQLPGLAATLLAATEQEHQRAAGAWHSEWLPMTAMLSLTGSAAAWAAELLPGLRPDPAAMAANLAATGGLPLAGRVAGLLAPATGRVAAHDLVREAAARATDRRLPLRAVLLADEAVRAALAQAGASERDLDEALDPARQLGAAGVFVDRALAAHRRASAADPAGTTRHRPAPRPPDQDSRGTGPRQGDR